MLNQVAAHQKKNSPLEALPKTEMKTTPGRSGT